LFGLGIRGIGLQTAKDIAELFNGDFLKFWTYLKDEAGDFTPIKTVKNIHILFTLQPISLHLKL